MRPRLAHDSLKLFFRQQWACQACQRQARSFAAAAPAVFSTANEVGEDAHERKGHPGSSVPQQGETKPLQSPYKRSQNVRRGPNAKSASSSLSTAKTTSTLRETQAKIRDANRRQRPWNTLLSPQDELLRAVDALRRQKPAISAKELVEWHNDPARRHATTQKTYARVLKYAYDQSDYKAANALVGHMLEMRIESNEEIAQIQLEAAMVRNDHRAVADVRRIMRKHGWSDTIQLNWTRNLSSGAKGSGDRPFDWRSGDNSAAAKHPKALPNLKEREPTVLSLRPDFVRTATPSQVINVCDGLVIDRYRSSAYKLTIDWLDETRDTMLALADQAQSADDSAKLEQLKSEYRSTAIALMNVLVKSLIASYKRETVQQSFTEGFVEAHAIPQLDINLKPSSYTLSTLIVGLRESPNAFPRSVAIVEWFAAKFGLPPDPDDARVASSTTGRAQPPPSEGHPVLATIGPGLAIRLLRHAIHDHKRRQASLRTNRRKLDDVLMAERSRKSQGLPLALTKAQLSEMERRIERLDLAAREQVAKVRTWWDSLERRKRAIDGLAMTDWLGFRMRETIRRAVDVGLLEESVHQQAHKAWLRQSVTAYRYNRLKRAVKKASQASS